MRDERLKYDNSQVLDLIYDYVDDQFRKGNFDIIDAGLASLTVVHFSTDILLGILTATLPAAENLVNRPLFYRLVKEVLIMRDQVEGHGFDDTILMGLE
jgi:hypothetical protein